MRVHQGPSDTVFTSVRSGPVPEDKPVIIASDVLRSYTGTYKTSGPGVTIAMAEEGQLTVELTGNSPLPMRAIAENEFRVDRVGARIVFHDDGGRVDRLTVHHRGRELQGRREQR